MMAESQSVTMSRAEIRRRKILERGSARMDKILTGSCDPIDTIQSVSHSKAGQIHSLDSKGHTLDTSGLLDMVDDEEMAETSFGDDKIGPRIEGILRQDLLKSMGTHPLVSLVGDLKSTGSRSGLKSDQLSARTVLILITLAIISSLLNTNLWLVQASIIVLITLISGRLISKKKLIDGCVITFFVFILVQAFKIHRLDFFTN